MAETQYACPPTQDVCSVAPLWPHLVQRARCRSWSLDWVGGGTSKLKKKQKTSSLEKIGRL